jgi:hypothetical protein
MFSGRSFKGFRLCNLISGLCNLSVRGENIIWFTIPSGENGDHMQNWKRALIAGSVGGATILLLKGKRPAAVLFGGVALAVLASEYPEKFTRIREELPSYVRQGTRFLDLAMKIGNKITELAQEQRQSMLEQLGEY